MPEVEPYDAGRAFGKSFFGVVAVRPDASASAMLELGILFAGYEGYRETRQGIRFAQGFMSVADAQKPDQLTGAE